MIHLFQSIPERRRSLVFLILLALSLVLMAALNILGAPLVTSAAPQGIVSFELAATPARAAGILASWDGPARLRAAFTLGLDYLFMPLYAAALSLACILAGGALHRRGWPLAGWAVPLAAAPWLAAGLDAVENVGLTALVFGALDPFWPLLSAVCAYGKFGLLFVGLVYSFLGLASRLAAFRP